MFRWRYRSIPVITEADLSEEGWAKRKALLEARGIDAGRYLRYEVPWAYEHSPEMKQSMRDFEASGGIPEELQRRSAFFKAAYRSSVVGVLSVALVVGMNVAGVYRHAFALLLVIGIVCLVAIIASTTQAMVLFVRYLPVRNQRPGSARAPERRVADIRPVPQRARGEITTGNK